MLNRRAFIACIVAAIFGFVRVPARKPLHVPDNSGLFGLRYCQVDGSAGCYMGLSRSWTDDPIMVSVVRG